MKKIFAFVLMFCMLVTPTMTNASTPVGVVDSNVDDSVCTFVNADGILWEMNYKTDEVPFILEKDISKVSGSMFVIRSDGSLWGKGPNKNGVIYVSADEMVTEYVKLLDNVKSVYGTTEFVFALKENGELYSWGLNPGACLGTGDLESCYQPTLILDDVKEFEWNNFRVLALKNDGSVWRWGNTRYIVQAEQRTPPNYNLHQKKPEKMIGSIKKIIMQETYDMAIDNENNLWAWGNNSWGQLGSAIAGSDKPTLIIGNVKEVYTSNTNSTVVTNDGELYIWGSYFNGTYARWATDDVSKTKRVSQNPLKIASDVDDVKMLTPDDFIILNKNSELWAYGNEDIINMLDAYKDDDIFTKIDVDVAELCSNTQHNKHICLYIKTDGSLWGWGSNRTGLLGVNNACDLTEPVNTAKEVYWVYSYGDGYNYGITYIVKTDGSVWCCGQGNPEVRKIIDRIKMTGNIDVYVNNKIIYKDTTPYIKNDRTMVPMRAIFEALGATVTWDDATKTAIGVKDGIEVKITIGENMLYKNGEAIELDAPAEITNDRTMVPVRAISEAFGCTVNWNNETKTVEITY